MRFDRVTNIATLGLCVLLTAHLAYTYRYLVMSPRLLSDIRDGAVIKDSRDLRLRTAERTLIMITSSKCRFCQESLPFYVRLTAAAPKHNIHTIALTTEDLDVHRTFLAKGGIKVDGIASAEKNKLVVQGTPTLILVSRSGTVLHSWVGKLTTDQESAVMQGVTSESLRSTN